MDRLRQSGVVWWVVVIIIVTVSDAFRDVWRGQVGWWWWHTVKWIQFYPLLGYVWFVKLGKWDIGGVVVRLAVVVLALVLWNCVAIWQRPPH